MADEIELKHKPFGLAHPTWERPDCFRYDTAEDAAAAVIRTYGDGSGHVVVGVITPPGVSQ